MKFLSSAEQGDQLGRSIATAGITGRDIIVAGAPGNGKAGLFCCSTLSAAGSWLTLSVGASATYPDAIVDAERKQILVVDD